MSSATSGSQRSEVEATCYWRYSYLFLIRMPREAVKIYQTIECSQVTCMYRKAGCHLPKQIGRFGLSVTEGYLQKYLGGSWQHGAAGVPKATGTVGLW